ncbi:MAG: DNA repair protein RecN [Eubacteriales bacterium]|mgnify:CR=1 FL=1|jgi:DNA repair protein RecN (Recombination protein N)|nr:DNA repair protein RecN [Eubacteriales bacterium]
MLEQLTIRDFALFDEITVAFVEGLSALTGETGAGKSLVVDAVSFLCGAKADKDMIRFGSQKAYVEGVFRTEGNREVLQALAALEITPEDGTLVISRELNSSGRNISRINGLPAPLNVLKQVTEALVDIHGQHEHQSLLNENRHLTYLDSFGGPEHQALCGTVKKDYEAYRHLYRQYQVALENARTREERLELLRLKDRELASAGVEPGEDSTLEQRRDLLRHAVKIKTALNEAYSAVYGGRESGESALELTKLAHRKISDIAMIDVRFQSILERVQSTAYELEELGHDLRLLNEGIDTDSVNLEAVEERLDLLRRLSRKYGATADEMLERWQEIRNEISKLEELEETLDGLFQSLEKQKMNYRSSAMALSSSRKSLSLRFESLVGEHLQELNMGGSRFRVSVEPDFARISPDGVDEVKMLVAPNIGEDFKPLAKIASGGELSRLMLALKAITADANAVPTMVFDEIDTGISGVTAQVVARKLWDIARYRQVICVTHLHQIAAMASQHMEVEKTESQGRTKTTISKLDEIRRIQSLAGMLGGNKAGQESGLQHANVLLDEASAYRATHPQVTE